jgi:hypothetical protein
MKEEKEYRFSYMTNSLRFYKKVKASNIEEAHQKGKEDALKYYPNAHGFFTEAGDLDELRPTPRV